MVALSGEVVAFRVVNANLKQAGPCGQGALMDGLAYQNYQCVAGNPGAFVNRVDHDVDNEHLTWTLVVHLAHHRVNGGSFLVSSEADTLVDNYSCQME